MDGMASSAPALHDVVCVESEPMLALLAERWLSAGLPLERGEDSGLGPFSRVGFFGTVGLATPAADHRKSTVSSQEIYSCP